MITGSGFPVRFSGVQYFGCPNEEAQRHIADVNWKLAKQFPCKLQVDLIQNTLPGGGYDTFAKITREPFSPGSSEIVTRAEYQMRELLSDLYIGKGEDCIKAKD